MAATIKLATIMRVAKRRAIENSDDRTTSSCCRVVITKKMLQLLVAITTNGCTVVASQMPSLVVPHSCSSFLSNAEAGDC